MINNELHLSIFADERKKIEDRWDYIGLLIIPTMYLHEILEYLSECRNCVNYKHELKFSELNSKGKGEKFELANKWVDLFVNDARTSPDKIFFKAFGIDTHYLNHSFFSDKGTSKGTYATVYNRFFRSAIHGALKYFFPNQEVIVDAIVHDNEGNLQQHGYFDWHTIWKLQENEPMITFKCSNLLFVDSDHHEEQLYPTYSHFIQFVDIILGVISYCIHFTNPRNRSQYSLAEKTLPLIKRIINNPNNRNSSYGYYRKYDICHFPNQPITDFEGTIIPGSIYRYWSLCFEEHCSGQLRIDF